MDGSVQDLLDGDPLPLFDFLVNKVLDVCATDIDIRLKSIEAMELVDRSFSGNASKRTHSRLIKRQMSRSAAQVARCESFRRLKKDLIARAVAAARAHRLRSKHLRERGREHSFFGFDVPHSACLSVDADIDQMLTLLSDPHTDTAARLEALEAFLTFTTSSISKSSYLERIISVAEQLLLEEETIGKALVLLAKLFNAKESRMTSEAMCCLADSLPTVLDSDLTQEMKLRAVVLLYKMMVVSPTLWNRFEDGAVQRMAVSVMKHLGKVDVRSANLHNTIAILAALDPSAAWFRAWTHSLVVRTVIKPVLPSFVHSAFHLLTSISEADFCRNHTVFLNYSPKEIYSLLITNLCCALLYSVKYDDLFDLLDETQWKEMFEVAVCRELQRESRQSSSKLITKLLYELANCRKSAQFLLRPKTVAILRHLTCVAGVRAVRIALGVCTPIDESLEGICELVNHFAVSRVKSRRLEALKCLESMASRFEWTRIEEYVRFEIVDERVERCASSRHFLSHTLLHDDSRKAPLKQSSLIYDIHDSTPLGTGKCRAVDVAERIREVNERIFSLREASTSHSAQAHFSRIRFRSNALLQFNIAAPTFSDRKLITVSFANLFHYALEEASESVLTFQHPTPRSLRLRMLYSTLVTLFWQPQIGADLLRYFDVESFLEEILTKAFEWKAVGALSMLTAFTFNLHIASEVRSIGKLLRKLFQSKVRSISDDEGCALDEFSMETFVLVGSTMLGGPSEVALPTHISSPLKNPRALIHLMYSQQPFLPPPLIKISPQSEEDIAQILLQTRYFDTFAIVEFFANSDCAHRETHSSCGCHSKLISMASETVQTALEQEVGTVLDYAEYLNLTENRREARKQIAQLKIPYYKEHGECDWFMSVMMLMGGMRADVVNDACERLLCHRYADTFWPSANETFCDSVAAAVFPRVRALLGHRRLSPIGRIFMRERLPVSHLLLVLLSQLYLNILDWPDICQYVILSILSGPDFQAKHFCAFLMHLEGTLRAVESREHLIECIVRQRYTATPFKYFDYVGIIEEIFHEVTVADDEPSIVALCE